MRFAFGFIPAPCARLAACAALLCTAMAPAAAPLTPPPAPSAPDPLPPPSAIAALPVALSLDDDHENRWVPFTLTPGNQILFTALLNGQAVTAILDTGVSVSVLAHAAADRARFPVKAGGHASAIGGTVDIGTTPLTSLAFGAVQRRGGNITVTALPAIATGSAQAVDMLIGHDLLDSYALDIDFDQKRFRLLPSGRLPFQGESAPLSISRRLGVYVSSATIGGERLQPMIVDSGDGASITVSQASWQATRPAPDTRTTTAIAFGLGGPIISDLAVMPSLGLGQLTARDVEVRIEPSGGFSQSVGVAGRIGTGLLQRYRVLLDPRAGRMVFGPASQSNAATMRSTSGVLVQVESDRLRVIHVMRGGPAAAAGWQVGDVICAIDGQPIPSGYARSPLAHWSVDTPGKTVTLGMCDGSRRRLTLRHFY